MTDPVRKYCTPVEGKTNVFSCNFCDLVIHGGGVTRMKLHLGACDSQKNVKKCDKCPPEVRDEMRQVVREKHDKKRMKKTMEETIRSELRQNIHLLDSDDEEHELAFQKEMRRAMKKSREETVAEAMGMRSSAGGSSGSQSELRRSASTIVDRPLAPSLYKSDSARQKKVSEMMNPGWKKKLGRLVTKFFVHENIPANKAKSHHFKNMLSGAAELGPGVPLPTPYEIHNTYLEIEYQEINTYVDKQREKWQEFGCTIMADGWTGPTRLSIINIMVYSSGKTVFLKSVDASNKIKDSDYIYKELNEVVKNVGSHNVVQIVTDNGSAYKKAGRKLMKKYNIYWTPCAAHCIDLMFEDIGKRESIAQAISKARNITKFIYNHGNVLAQMRELCGGEIIRPGPTRFATNYLALRSLREKKSALRNMFTSEWWEAHKLRNSSAGKVVEELVLDNRFWAHIDDHCKVFEPMYSTLRLVDTEVVPTMGLLYHVFHLMKTKLEQLPGKKWAVDIVTNRWDTQMYHSLHEAAYFLNPKLQYNPEIRIGSESMMAVSKVFDTLYPHDDSDNIGNELVAFRDAKGDFETRSAIAGRMKMDPAEWWGLYGHKTPTLRKLAMRILSQTASSSACERNWSTFALIHTKQRNRLAYKRLEQLVFCNYNMKLMIRDRESELDNVLEQDPLDIIQRSLESVGVDDGDDELLRWIRPIHMDDEAQNPDPEIAGEARSLGVDVDRVLSEEVCSGSHDGGSSDDTASGGGGGGYGSLNPSSSRGGDGGSQYGGGSHGDGGYRGRQYTPWTEERGFTHATQDEDHGARSAFYDRGCDSRQREMTSTMSISSSDVDQMSLQFESMSFTGESSEASFPYDYPPPYYNYNNYGYPPEPYGTAPQLQILSHTGTHGQIITIVTAPGYPLHNTFVGLDQYNYDMHLQTYLSNYSRHMSWYDYTMLQNQQPHIFQPPRHSTWN